jgi:hypothetical protein
LSAITFPSFHDQGLCYHTQKVQSWILSGSGRSPAYHLWSRFTLVYESVSNLMTVALVSARMTQRMIEASATLRFLMHASSRTAPCHAVHLSTDRGRVNRSRCDPREERKDTIRKTAQSPSDNGAPTQTSPPRNQNRHLTNPQSAQNPPACREKPLSFQGSYPMAISF